MDDLTEIMRYDNEFKLNHGNNLYDISIDILAKKYTKTGENYFINVSNFSSALYNLEYMIKRHTRDSFNGFSYL